MEKVKMDFSFDKNEEKEWLKNILRTTHATIVFEKKDGTLREMKCTLSESRIPSEFMPKNEKTSTRAVNDNALAVFDLEKNAWRSFRYDSIKEIHFDSYI